MVCNSSGNIRVTVLCWCVRLLNAALYNCIVQVQLASLDSQDLVVNEVFVANPDNLAVRDRAVPTDHWVQQGTEEIRVQLAVQVFQE